MDMESEGRRDRAVGALVGLAVGDAVGTTLEFVAPSRVQPISDMVGGGPFGLTPGQWTDDTSMALCLAESIIDTDSLDLADQMRRYVLWYREGYLSSTGRCFDIGNTTRHQLERFERTGQPIADDVDEESAANGSLMRLAPVAVRWGRDVAATMAMAEESSRPTHPARRPREVCQVMAVVLARLINGESWEAATDPDLAALRARQFHPEVEAIVQGSWRTKEPPAIRGTGYCIDALEAALWAVDRSTDFRQAVLRAANLGDDADTSAAIAGQLAGARWGLSGIPDPWLTLLARGPRIRSLAEHLLDSERDSDGPWVMDDFVHAWWVRKGSLLAGEYPGHREPAVAEDKVNVLVDAGIRTFIDLTTPEDRLTSYEPFVVAAARNRQLDLRRLSFPIPDVSVIADGGYHAIVQAVAEGRERGGVYVHCWGGVGRTATVIGCVLADEGHSFDDVTRLIDEARASSRKAHRSAPETQLQRDVIQRRCEAVATAGRQASSAAEPR